jgi:uncharacterized membrane protein (UPF0127 family)
MFVIVGIRQNRGSFWTPNGFGSITMAYVYSNYITAEREAFKVYKKVNHMSSYYSSISVIELPENSIYSTQTPSG